MARCQYQEQMLYQTRLMNCKTVGHHIVDFFLFHHRNIVFLSFFPVTMCSSSRCIKFVMFFHFSLFSQQAPFENTLKTHKLGTCFFFRTCLQVSISLSHSCLYVTHTNKDAFLHGFQPRVLLESEWVGSAASSFPDETLFWITPSETVKRHSMVL